FWMMNVRLSALAWLPTSRLPSATKIAKDLRMAVPPGCGPMAETYPRRRLQAVNRECAGRLVQQNAGGSKRESCHADGRAQAEAGHAEQLVEIRQQLVGLHAFRRADGRRDGPKLDLSEWCAQDRVAHDLFHRTTH